MNRRDFMATGGAGALAGLLPSWLLPRALKAQWKVAGHYFCPSYAARLETLPGVEVSAPGEADRQVSVLPARFDGGVGLLAAMEVD